MSVCEYITYSKEKKIRTDTWTRTYIVCFSNASFIDPSCCSYIIPFTIVPIVVICFRVNRVQFFRRNLEVGILIWHRAVWCWWLVSSMNLVAPSLLMYVVACYVSMEDDYLQYL
jgi:hypothetical protein